MTRNMSRRSIVAAIAAAPFTLPSSTAQAQVFGDFSFQSDYGAVLSNARLALWDPGDGDYVAKLTIRPTQSEIDALLASGSHVDFEFTFFGLGRIGARDDFSGAVSDYVRRIGDRVRIDASQHPYPILEVSGLNILKRWRPNQEITITASLYGYQPVAEFRPRMAVTLVSSAWWNVGEAEPAAYERETGDVTYRYNSERGFSSALVNQYWESQFLF